MKRFFAVAVLAWLGIGTVAAAENVLVLGGTGRLGSMVAKEIVKQGHSVTVFARPTSDRGRLAGVSVSYVLGDLGSGSDIARAIESNKFTVIIDASGRRTADKSYSHAVTMPQIVRASKAGKTVRQIVFVSSVGAGRNLERFPGINWTEYLPLLAERGAAEQSLIDSGIAYTIIRSGAVLEGNDPATGTAYFTEDQGVLGATRRPDLAALTAKRVGKAAGLNKIYHAADDALKLPTGVEG